MNIDLNFHFAIESKEYTGIEDWSEIVRVSVNELNERLLRHSEHKDRRMYIPTIILRKDRPEADMPWSSDDYPARIAHLKRLLEICK